VAVSGFHRLAVVIDDLIHLSFSIVKSFVTINATFNMNIQHNFVINKQLANIITEL
jgi:hypothetical protein